MTAKQRRTMKRGEVYEIEELDRNREWQVVCRCASIADAKSVLKILKETDGGKKHGKQNRSN